MGGGFETANLSINTHMEWIPYVSAGFTALAFITQLKTLERSQEEKKKVKAGG